MALDWWVLLRPNEVCERMYGVLFETCVSRQVGPRECLSTWWKLDFCCRRESGGHVCMHGLRFKDMSEGTPVKRVDRDGIIP